MARTRSWSLEGEKGRLASAGLRTMNSWTDTSIEPVGSWVVTKSDDVELRGRFNKGKSTDGTLGVVWSRSYTPLY